MKIIAVIIITVYFRKGGIRILYYMLYYMNAIMSG